MLPSINWYAEVGTMLALAVVIFTFTTLVVRFISERQSVIIKKSIETTRTSLEKSIRSSSTREEAKRMKLKEQLITNSKPKYFLYMNNDIITSLVSQMEGTLKLSELEKDVTGISRRKLGFEKIVSASTEKEGMETIKEKYQSVSSIYLMYNSLEKNLLENDQLTLGLEHSDYDHTIEENFKKKCEEIKREFDFEIPKSVKDEFIKINEKKYTVEYKQKEMKAASDYVLLIGAFDVRKFNSEDWELSYTYPYEIPGGKLRIKLKCGGKYVTESGKNIFPSVKIVKVKILGKVIFFDEENLIFLIEPIAIY